MSEFQKYLRNQLEMYHLSVEDAAQLFDVSIPSVQRWLNGDVIPMAPIQNIIHKEFTKLNSNRKLP